MQASTRLGTSRGALVVFAVALLCRLLFVSLTTITPISDAERYSKQAERLLDGRGFTSDEGKPTGNAHAHDGGWMHLEDEVDLRRDEPQGAPEARRSLKWIRENPIAYAKLTLRRALAWISVAPDYVPSIALTSTAQIDDKVVRAFHETWSTGGEPREPPDLLELQHSKRINSSILIVWSLLTIPLAVAGMILDASDRPKWLLLLPLITYVSSLSVTFMDSRYREVMMPIWLIYTAVGFWGLPHLSRSWQRASLASRRVLLLGLPIALLFCFQLVRDRHAISGHVARSQER